MGLVQAAYFDENDGNWTWGGMCLCLVDTREIPSRPREGCRSGSETLSVIQYWMRTDG